MKKIFLVFILAFGMNFMGRGQLLIEQFNYTVGTLLTANGWTAHSGGGTNSPVVVSPGLTYSGYISSGGNCTSLLATGEDDNKAFTPQTSGSVYAAALVNVSSASATGDYFFHLYSSSSIFTARLLVKTNGSNLAFGIYKGTAASAVYTSFSYALNTTYLMVIKHTFNTGSTTDDVVSLFIDPATSGIEPSPTITESDAATDPVSISAIALRQGTAGNLVNAKVGSIRVANNWADIIGISAPTIQASNITFSSITTNGMTASWTIGYGAKRIVIMNTANSFTNPTDGTDPSANTVYSGSGEQVVFNNSGNTVSVTGLSIGTTYWFRVYEYNGSGSGTKYLTTTATNNPKSQATAYSLTLQPNLTGLCQGAIISVPIHITGNNVLGMDLYLDFDHTVLSQSGSGYDPLTLFSGFNVLYTYTYSGNTAYLGIMKNDLSGVNFTGEKLIDLLFVYNGGTTNIHFRTTPPDIAPPPLCELYDGVGNTITPVTYTDNQVTGSYLPGAAGTITGVTPVCQGTDGVSYSVPLITNATFYTWVYSGTGATIVGTTNSITINFSGTATSGNLTVAGTNICGNGTVSANFPITVNPILPVSVSIAASANPVCEGTSVTFTATPTNGGTTPAYQWFKNTVAVATGATYTYVPGDGDAIYVVLTSDATPCATGNPATSSTITMTVNLNLPVSVSIAASANPVCEGTSVTFTATPANGGTTPAYQWFKNTVAIATGATYTYIPGNGDAIYVVLTSDASCVTGNPATSGTITMTVNPNLPVSVSIAASANPVCAGTSVTFTATPANGGTTPAYQWFKNTVAVATGATYTYVPGNGDAIYVVLTSNATCATGSPATSGTITMTVNPNLPVSVSIAASANPVCAGASVTFTATPTNGGTTPAYQWFKNTIAVATGATYTYVPGNGDAIYVVLTSNATPCATGSPATSGTITMTVNPNLPVSVSIAASANPVCAGTSVTFTATPANGGTTPAYQWFKNTVAVATGATYTYSPANGDAIHVVLTSNATCVTGNPATSSTITMTVNPNLPVSVSIAASANPVCAGTSVTFTATPANGGTTPAYQWFKNTVAVATGATYTYIPGNGDAIYVVLTSNATCATGSPATSGTITMTVNPNLPVSVSIAASANPVSAGTSVTFTATPTNGGTTPVYQWFKNNIAVATGATYTYIPVNGDAIYVVLTSNATCATGSPATSTTIIMTVTSTAIASVTLQPDLTGACQGSIISVPIHITGNDILGMDLYLDFDHTILSLSGLGYANLFSGFNALYTYTYSGNTAYLGIMKNDLTGVNFTGEKLIDLLFVYNGGTTNIHFRTTPPDIAPPPLCELYDAVGGTMAPVAYADNQVTGSDLPGAAGSITGVTPVCQGTNGVAYSVPAITNATSYTWVYSGTGATIVGTTNSITINFSGTATSGDLTVAGTNSCGNGTVSPNFPITVNPILPVSVSIAASANPVCIGTSVTFTATPTNGGTTPAYQWFKNTVAVATGATYTYIPGDGDAIYVVLTSNATPCATGSPATSNTITMTVNPLPVVTAASMQNALSPTGPWSALNGTLATGYNMCIDPAIAFYYLDINSMTVSQTLLANSLNPFTLSQTSLPPTWLSYWAAKGVVSGATGWQGVMWNIINGNAPIFYIYYTSPGSDYQLIDGLTYQTGGGIAPLRVSGDYPQWSYTYNGTVTDVNGCISLPFSVMTTFNTILPVSVSIAASANPVCAGTSVTFTATPTNGGITPAYQWFKNTVAVATGDIYTYVPVNGDAIYVVLTSNATPCATGSPATSNTITMTVNPNLLVGSISASQSICAGSAPNPLIGVAPSNGTSPTYQWQSSLDNSIFTNISGATMLNYQPGILSATTYYRQMQNATGTCLGPLPTNVVTITVNPLPVVTAASMQNALSPTGPWSAMNGTLAAGYNMCIDPAISFYYLDINNMTVSQTLLVNTLNPFTLSQTSLPPTWLSYWAAKGVVSGATGWQGVMWNIINGNAPIFYIYYTSPGSDYQLIDGLTYQTGGGITPLRISGDYPQWTYTYNGTVTDVNGCISLPFSVMTTFNTIPLPTITGPDPVCEGSVQTYTTEAGMNGYTWTVVGGTGTSTINSISVTWGLGASGSVSVNYTDPNGCTAASATVKNVTISPNNTITWNLGSGSPTQIACINTAITNITYSTTGATGATFAGLPAGVSGSWIANVVTISGTPTASGLFHYTVTLTGGCGTITATGTLTINPNLLVGSISASQSICAGFTPDLLTGVAPLNGTSPTYQWQSSLDNSIFTNISGATMLDYQPGILSATTYYRQMQNATGTCLGPLPTNVLTISFNPNLLVGSISASQSICAGSTPNLLTGVAPSNGTSPTYQWQSSLDNSTFANISGATMLDYQPGTLSATTYYRQMQNATGTCLGPLPTNVLTISFNPNLLVGSISASQSICAGSAPNPLIGVAPLNGTSPTYQWQSSLDNNIFANISGATMLDYQPGILSATTYYRQMQNATGTCLGPLPTNVVTITVNPNNTITWNPGSGSTTQTVCINTAITAITYATTGATGATFSGLPAGVTGAWAGNVVTISGTPTASGTFSYTVTLTGGCGTISATGTITVNPNNTITWNPGSGSTTQTVCINTAITAITYATTGATGATFSGLPAGVTGAWASNVVTINGTPTVSGTFNYTVTLTGGCGTITATGTITVTPNNTITWNPGSGSTTQTVCINTAITAITYATTGATGATFSGLPAGVTGAWAGNVVTISGTPTVSGTFNYTVTLTGGCGTITATGTITVNPNNTITWNPGSGSTTQTVCLNTAITAITYATTGATGATFSGLPAGVTGAWAGNVVTISGTPTVSGTFNYTVTLTGGCGTATASGTITVNPNLPVSVSIAASANPVCAGTSVTFTATPINGGTIPLYQWYMNTIAVATGSNFTYVPANGDAIYVVMTSNAACVTGNPATSNTVTMTVNPIPPAPVVTNNGYTAVSSAPAGNQWYYSPTNTITGTLINGATDQTYDAQLTGTGWYWSIVTLNGCSSDSSNHHLIITVGIDPHSSASINIYPVPNDGRFNVSITTASRESFSISVYNNLGVKFYEETKVDVDGSLQKVIDLRPVPSGVYSVIFENSQNQVVKKIIVNK